jgi:uncharacterized protein (TIRG00374 family)
VGDADPTPPRWVRWVTRIALVAGAIGLIATVWLVGPSTIAGHLRTIGWWFAALIAVDLAMTCLDAAAVHSLTRGDGAPPYGRVLIAQIAGRAVNAVTPGGNLGEALKASLLAEQTRGSRVVGAVMFCGLASLCISLTMVAIGAPLTAILLDLHGAIRVALLVSGAIAAGVVVCVVLLVRRGMLESVGRFARRVRVLSDKRLEKWMAKLAEVDEVLSGQTDPAARRRAAAFVLASKSLGWFETWLIVATAGYFLGMPELAALLSAGIVLGWISTLVPMGLGVAEGGNYGLFGLIGPPAALGVSLALARRVLQIFSAIIGFAALGIYRLSRRGARYRRRSRERHQARATPSVARARRSDAL